MRYRTGDPPPLPPLDLPVPEPLRTYLLRGIGLRDGELPWRRLGADIELLPVRTPDRMATARLLRVAGSGAIPEHDQNGLELSVVLSGAFADGDALLAAGDFAMVDETVTHEPRATPDEVCICLVVAAR